MVAGTGESLASTERMQVKSITTEIYAEPVSSLLPLSATRPTAAELRTR